ncbi:hypothetical protein HYPSUDRAFT_150698 [Hypholoma sublateritium FD-334 SS-4]|uniref:CxC2-like cysteine cluster KDZ transposase-associated domain-containing protein n=1 Tax=Hypholoma sublateritium (strain FD-334 SS-4) TaxID=945553 RepID=A0A0D2P0M9_HYPSF|nr:hypothetical protein HYPSUDRAFT_150698 [Hypholoma sublateritium FD-334 SS-4]
MSVGEDCPCGRLDTGGTRTKATIKCMDCSLSAPACSLCFIDEHVARYTHWANIWNDEIGCYTRQDISCLGYVINLGHGGRPCPDTIPNSDIFFHIVDTNGVHNTKIRFCGCLPKLDRASQLLKHQLFPATMSRPTMAFTFRLMDFYNVVHVEGKISAYDFIGSIRRTTDNVFTHNVTDPYPQFRLVSRVWTLLANLKQQGHYHNINEVLTPLGSQRDSLVVACPACPQPMMNMEPTWRDTPCHLRHINQHQWTTDGNFHLNKYTKNTDPDDVSIYDGRAYFPPDNQYQTYLKKFPKDSKEKVVCDHLKALEKQQRKKFKNMDVTGVVQVQCSHVLVKSTVDLQLGERFANTDYALAMAIRQHNITELLDESMDLKESYDINCGFSVNASSRFDANFPELAAVVKKMSWLIPLVHIQNHKNNCMYLFSSSYSKGAGHFHGETAEMVWAESNQLGAQTRQMNGGHRHDTIINATSDWNWKKIANMANALMSDIHRAKALFTTKREILKSLTDLYSDRVPLWNKADRTVCPPKSGKEVQCVYRQKSEKLPSQSRVYELMLEDDDRQEQAEEYGNWTLSRQSKAVVAGLLTLGFSILSMQRRIQLKLEQRGKNTKRQVTDAELAKERAQLSCKIQKLRVIQKDTTPQVEPYVFDQHVRTKLQDLPEHEVLYLPSDFLENDRISLGLVEMGEDQRKLAEGAANDAILRVQKLAKVLSNSRLAKKADGSGQAYQTRATATETEIVFKLDLAIKDYNDLRRLLMKFGLPDNDSVYRPLALVDTFRKPTATNRNLGDTYRNDGPLWAANAGITAGARPPTGSQVSMTSQVATQTTKPMKRKDLSFTVDKYVTLIAYQNIDGWIWSFMGRAHMSSQDLQDYLDEGDRVQWFRAEAEKERWQEEWEMRQADYLRCVRYFKKMGQVWMSLVTDVLRDDSVQLGMNAYARKQARMYTDMNEYAVKLLIGEGYGHLLDGEKPLYRHLDEVRALPENVLSYKS